MKPWLLSSILIAEEAVQTSMSGLGMWIRYDGETILDGPDMATFSTENIYFFNLSRENWKVFTYFSVRIIKKMICKWNLYLWSDFHLLIVEPREFKSPLHLKVP